LPSWSFSWVRSAVRVRWETLRTCRGLTPPCSRRPRSTSMLRDACLWSRGRLRWRCAGLLAGCGRHPSRIHGEHAPGERRRGGLHALLCGGCSDPPERASSRAGEWRAPYWLLRNPLAVAFAVTAEPEEFSCDGDVISDELVKRPQGRRQVLL